MAKDEFDLEDDDLDWGELDNWGESDDMGDLTDGSENDPKKRKPVNAIKDALKEGFGENTSTKNVVEHVKKVLPEGFSVATDELSDYSQKTQDLYLKSRQEIEKNVNTLKREGGRLVKAYDKQIPGFLKNILNKVTELEEESAEERQKSEDEKQIDLMNEELNALNHAQLEMQKLAESRELMRDQIQGQRFESQQELLFGIKTGIQRNNEQNEKIAYRQRNKLLEISYLQLFAQRTIQRTLVQSAEHQKTALDSIVKNTALPEFVKQYKSEMMKEVAIRSTMGKATEKLGEYVSNFKNKLFENAGNYVQGHLDNLNMVTESAQMGADGILMMKEMNDEFGGPSKTLAQHAATHGGKQLSEFFINNIVKRTISGLDNGGRVSAATEWLDRTVKNIPFLANRWKSENESADGLKGILASILPESRLGELSHDADSFSRLNDMAQFDNATRKSIVDIIPALLAKIHQSTDAIRRKVANDVPVSDDNLLEWDHDNATLTTRKQLDDRLTQNIKQVANIDGVRDNAIKLVNLIDKNDELPDDLKSKLAKEFMLSLGDRKGFNPGDYLDRSWKVKDLNKSEIKLIEDLIAKRFPNERDLDEKFKYEYQKDLSLVHKQWLEMEAPQGVVADVLHNRSRMSSVEANRHKRLNLATLENGNYTAKGRDYFNDENINKSLNTAVGTELMKQKVSTEDADIPLSVYDFQQEETYVDNGDGNGGTVANPKPNHFKPGGKKKERLNYDEWVEYRKKYYLQDNALRSVGSFMGKVIGFTKPKVAAVAKGIVGEERATKISKKVDDTKNRIAKGAKDFGRITKLDKQLETLTGNIKSFNSELKGTILDSIYNSSFDFIDRESFAGEETLTFNYDKFKQRLNKTGGEDLKDINRFISEEKDEEGNVVKPAPGNDEIVKYVLSKYRESEEGKKLKERVETVKESGEKVINKVSEKGKEYLTLAENKGKNLVDAAKNYYEENKNKSPKEIANQIKSDLGKELKSLKDSKAKTKFIEYALKVEEFTKDEEVRKYLLNKLKNIATDEAKSLYAKIDEKTGITQIGKELDERFEITDNISAAKEKIAGNKVVKYATGKVQEGYDKFIKDKSPNEIVDGILEHVGISEDNRTTIQNHLNKLNDKVEEISNTTGKGIKKIKGHGKSNARQLKKIAKRLFSEENREIAKGYSAEIINAIKNQDAKRLEEIAKKVTDGIINSGDNTSEKDSNENDVKGFTINSIRNLTDIEQRRLLLDNRLSTRKIGETPQDVRETIERNPEVDPTEDVKDIYVKGESSPIITARDLREGKYYSKQTGKEIYSIADIDGPILDKDGNHVITEEHIQQGLVDKQNTEIFNEGEKQGILNKVKQLSKTINKGSWGLTKWIANWGLRIISKPFRKTMNTTDVYLPPEVEGEKPRLVLSRWKMIAGWYKDENNKTIKDVRDLKGNVYDRFGNIVMTEDELKKAVDKYGKPLSKSYLVRRTRTAIRGIKTLAKPLIWGGKLGLGAAKLGLKAGKFVGDSVTGGAITNAQNKITSLPGKLKFWKKNEEDNIDNISGGESYLSRRTKLAMGGLSTLGNVVSKATGLSYLKRKAGEKLDKAKNNLADKFTPNFMKGFGSRKGVMTDDGIAIDSKTGKARENNYKAEMKADDEEKKRRDEEAKKRQDAEIAGRAKKDKEGGILGFLKKWFPLIFGSGGMLFGIFKNGFTHGIKKIGELIWSGGKWLVKQIFKLPGKIATALMGLFTGKKAVDAVSDVLDKADDVDVDVDKKDKRTKSNKPNGKKPTKGRGGIKKKIPNVFKSTTSSTVTNKALGKTTSMAAESVAKATTNKVAQGAVSKAATTVGAQIAKKGLGRVALAALGPIGAVIGAAWLAWDIGSFVWDMFKSPNKVDKFRLAAYGVNPESDHRSNTVLRLENWMIEKTKVIHGKPNIPNPLKFKDDKEMAEIFAMFVGGDKGFELLGSMGDDERKETIGRLDNWLKERFIPVYTQHAISLYQIDRKTTLKDAFGLTGDLKDGLVMPWARRAIFNEEDSLKPYDVLYDPFIQVEDETEDEARMMGYSDVLKYYTVLDKAYGKDETNLRKQDKMSANSALLNGEKYNSLFSFEDTTKRLNQMSGKDKIELSKQLNQTLTNKHQFNNGLGVKKLDGTKANVEQKGNHFYLKDDIDSVNLDGRSIIDDGIAVRMKVYGLIRLVDNHVNTLLKLEKELENKLNFTNDGVKLDNLDIDDIAKRYSGLFNWLPNDDLSKFKAWLKMRFIPAYLALAINVYKLSKQKDIINVLVKNKLKNYQLVSIYLEMSSAKFVDKFSIPVWNLSLSPVKNEEGNQDTRSIVINLQNLREGNNDKLLTEKTPNTLNTNNTPIKPENVNTGNIGGILSNIGKGINESISSESPKTNIANSYSSLAVGISNQVSPNSNTGVNAQYSVSGGTVKDYKASKKPKKVELSKTIITELDKLGWSETEKNHFLSQITHETAGLQYLEELANGKAYEGRKDLGNTQPGDGPKFKGRGVIQLTGRVNYQKLADKLNRPDIMDRPQVVAEDPYLAFHSALIWWENKKKESGAFRKALQTDDVTTVRKGVNGGKNGLNDTISQYAKYKAGGGVIREMAGKESKKEENKPLSNQPTVTPQSQSTTAPVNTQTTQPSFGGGQTGGGGAGGSWVAQTPGGNINSAPELTPPSSLPKDLNEGKIAETATVENKQNTTDIDVGSNTTIKGSAKSMPVPGNPMHKVTITKEGMSLMNKATPELVNLGKQFIAFIGGGKDNQGMIPEFMTLFFAAVGDFIKSTNEKTTFKVTSAFRSNAKQQKLYQENLRKKGRDDGYVAKPGKSMHEFGIALDIENTGRKNNGKTKADFEVGLLTRWEKWGSKSKWGFYRRLRPGGRVVEDWHVENVHFLRNGQRVPGQVPDGPATVNEVYNPLETAANNGTYNDQTIGNKTVATNTQNVNPGVNPSTQTSSNQKVATLPTTAPTSYSSATQQTDLVGMFSSSTGFKNGINTISSNLTGEKLFNEPSSTIDPMTKFMTKQNASVETQQRHLLKEQKAQSDKMIDVLTKQLNVQEEIRNSVSKLLSFIEKKKGDDLTQGKESSNDSDKYSHISAVDRVLSSPKEVVGMRIGGNSIMRTGTA